MGYKEDLIFISSYTTWTPLKDKGKCLCLVISLLCFYLFLFILPFYQEIYLFWGFPSFPNTMHLEVADLIEFVTLWVGALNAISEFLEVYYLIKILKY